MSSKPLKIAFNPGAPAFDPSAKGNVGHTPNNAKHTNGKHAASYKPTNKLASPIVFYPPKGTSALMPASVDPLLGESLAASSPETVTVIQAMLDLSTAHKISFLGTLPALPTRHNLEGLTRKEYLVTMVPHGAQRYLMLILNGNVYLVNKKMIAFNATRFFNPDLLTDAAEHSVIDGFIVQRNDGSWQFLIYDAVAAANQTLRSLHLESRLAAVEQLAKQVLDAQVDLLSADTGGKGAEEFPGKPDSNAKKPPFPRLEMRIQKYYPVDQLQKLSELASASRKKASVLPWKFGGYLFVPAGGYYRLGYNEYVIRWKPQNQIYADFLLSTVSVPGFQEPWHQLQKLDAAIGVTVHDWLFDKDNRLAKANVKSGQIIECFWDPQGRTCVPTMTKNGKTEKKVYKGGWVFHRIRHDCKMPNEGWMVQKVVDQIDAFLPEAKILSIVQGLASPPQQRKSEGGRGAGRSGGGRGGARNHHHHHNGRDKPRERGRRKRSNNNNASSSSSTASSKSK